MSERSLQAYDHYKDLRQRAEYLLLGLLAASIAFFWQNSKSEVLGVNPATLHLVGLLFLLIALLCGLVRIEKQPDIFALNSDVLDLASEKAKLITSLSQGKSVVSGTRGVMHPEMQAKRIEAIDKNTGELTKKMDDINDQCIRLFRLRNICMTIGYLIFLGHRIWIPYFNFK